MSVGGIGFDPGQRLPPLRDRATAQRCDYPGCPECGNPIEVAAIGPALRYRLSLDGVVGPLTYHSLTDVVGAAVGSASECVIYRESEGGDLLLMARVKGRGLTE